MLDSIKEREKLQDTLERSSEQTKTTNEMLAATRLISEKFYYQAALLSGGTIVLSVTFLGYLETSGQPVLWLPLLMLSWMSLLAAFLGALYRNHHWMRQTHFHAMSAALEHKKATADQMLKVVSADPAAFVNLRTPEELKEFRDRQADKIGKIEKNEPWYSARAKRAELLTQVCEWATHLGLTVGLILLLVFAGINVWLNIGSGLAMIHAPNGTGYAGDR
ncbi:MAG: hypothetical protein HYS41_02200 [Candidatus Omnitrophica bacterium]|nr:hypothetical protein [Candidatus Omnitrophota bacterium]